MSEMYNYQVLQGRDDKGLIKAWVNGVLFEDHARAQLRNIAAMPFIHKWVAAMPDCLASNTEVLTDSGFKRIVDLDIATDHVANVDVLSNYSNVSFRKPKNILRRNLRDGEKTFLFNFSPWNRGIIMSENHRVALGESPGELAKNISHISCMKDYIWSGNGVAAPIAGFPRNELLLLAWIVADSNFKIGCVGHRGNFQFGLKKKRKIDRIRFLMDEAGFKYGFSEYDRQTEIRLSTDDSQRFLQLVGEGKNYPIKLLLSLPAEDQRAFLREVVCGDGDYETYLRSGSGSFRFNSKRKQDIDDISAIASMCYGASVSHSRTTIGFDGLPCEMHYLNIISNNSIGYSKSGFHSREVMKSEAAYNDEVVCIECDTGFFIARQNGITFVTGNCHAGIGCCVGSVIPTAGAIVPAAVGVDIGCGLVCAKTSLMANDLPTNLAAIRAAIEEVVPHGRTNDGGANDKGAWGEDQPPTIEVAWMGLEQQYRKIIAKHPKVSHRYPEAQLGTLGTGNHFVEMCLDENDCVWFMLHSGSRGPGNRIGQYFIELAKEDMRRFFINLPDENLAYLPEGTEHFDDYVEALKWAQEYAAVSRELMMHHLVRAVNKTKKVPKFTADSMIVDCKHNYASLENHYGRNVWVTRKGAISAKKGQLGVIPSAMGKPSYIVSGKGNPESFHSASHGAGRAMSRTQARNQFTLKDLREQTAGVECRKDSDVIDEIPGAYKPIDKIMAAQSDLVDIVHTLKAVLCVKG